MPELPEVETVARDLRPLVTGATITNIRNDWPRTIRGEDVEGFAEGVIGRTITGTSRRAKLLLLELSGDRVIAVHLKMTGQLFVVPKDAPQDRFVHLVFELHDGRELRFRDIRKFGRVGVYPRAAIAGGAAARELGAGDVFELGPEPLDPAFTLAAFRMHLAGRRGRLKTLLTDQTFLAGIGNIYADEALWRARLHPLRSAASLRRDDQKRLYEAIRSVLAEAVAFRGSSIDDYTAPEGDGAMQERLQVYQRAGEPCPRCGRPLHRVVLGARSTHFCSWCQRLSAADRNAAAKILAAERAPRGRGRRWTELDGGEGVGLTADERAAADRRSRTERTRRAAATRRASARGSAEVRAEISPASNSPTPDHRGATASNDPTPDDLRGVGAGGGA
jgi:formamidopyrimidine-DNA glycosylase